MSIKKADVTSFLKSHAAALSDGDLEAIASAWHTPSLVVDEQGSIAVSKAKQVVDFFRQAVAAYHESGIVAVRLESAEMTRLSPRVVTVTVTWRQIRSDGKKGQGDRSFYVISKQGLLGKLGIDLASQVGGA
jgi:hypothetical protein